ncbi:MAG: hypothetical protein GFH27_549283n138 [Chloroflexi bacterium AL-W]|nr:hypothetical protein [Chloroflexi bacterium AL-N1]NOK64741.1 hypothetical protein [Chloroflexi bacterium AL-N10]NOK75982.1 hypothetical protein [Chloroflexi bacterium AL-N5]NOK80259.1 hypothetical protein [Chloroflexi bacterium AL-W]NOK86772.1 hypothetical protein [Chloroflexi bacterium AL-N15]
MFYDVSNLPVLIMLLLVLAPFLLVGGPLLLTWLNGKSYTDKDGTSEEATENA